MKKYLPDSDICISYLKGRFRLNEKIKKVGRKNCYVSEITIAELTYGAEKSDDHAKHFPEVERIIDRFQVLPIYENIPTFAKEKVRLQKAGTLIPDFDLLIGSTAIAQNLILVTNNKKHLRRLENLEIENWRKKEFNEFLN